MSDNDQSIYTLRFNQVANELEGFGGGTPQWTPLIVAGTGGISQLTGDVTAGPGTGSQVATLATVNPDVGSFTNANVTVDGKGRITAVSNGSSTLPGGPSGAVQFNDTGTFGGSNQFTWDDSATILTLTNTVTNPDIRLRADLAGEVIHFTSTDDLTTYGFLSLNPAHGGVINLTATKAVQISGGNGAFAWSFGDDGTLGSPNAKISNLADPTDPQDAATKAYVDANGSSPAGTDTAIQFNDTGAFGGNAATLSWDHISSILHVSNGSTNEFSFSPSGEMDINNDGGGSIVFNNHATSQTFVNLTADTDHSLRITGNNNLAKFAISAGYVVFGVNDLSQLNNAVLTVHGQTAINVAANENLYIHDQAGILRLEAADNAFASNTPMQFAATDYSFVFSGSERITMNAHEIALTERNGDGSNAQLRLAADAPDNMIVNFTDVANTIQHAYLSVESASNAMNFVAFGDVRFSASNTSAMTLDASVTAGQTRMLLWDVDSGSLQRVTVGAANSGGAGFKVLRIPN